MTLLDPAELAEIRGYAESGMTSEATILVRSIIETADGTESVWATGDTVPCWVKEITGQGATLGGIAGAVGIGETFSIRLPVGSDAGSGDQLAIGSTIYMIQHTNADDTYAPWLVCICRTVD